MELVNKNIIVTGGAGGIGSALVKELLLRGNTVCVIDNNKEAINKLEEQLSRKEKERLKINSVDASSFEEVESAVDDFYDEVGEIHVLVNNAAILDDGLLINVSRKGIEKYPLENWNRTIGTNLSGYFYFSREVAEKMIAKRTKGVIVNVSSISSGGNLGQTSYAAAKSAVNALTVTWAQELALYGIRVAGLSPGMTDTDMPRKAMKDSMLDDWISKTPLRRMGKPEELAKGIIFILENDFVNGRTLEIDGGLRM